MTMITQRNFEDQMNEIMGDYKVADGYAEDREVKAIQLIIDVLKQFGYQAGIKVFTDKCRIFH